MIGLITGITWFVTAIGVLLSLAAAVGRLPARVAFGLLGAAFVATVVGVAADVVLLVQGWKTPDLATHIGYLISLPFIIPAGLVLTYKKIDRWGLLILGIATLITAIMIVRQVQTLGLPFGYVNVRPVGG